MTDRAEAPVRSRPFLERPYKALPALRAEAFISVLVPKKRVEVITRISPEEKELPVLGVLINELLERAAVNRREYR